MAGNYYHTQEIKEMNWKFKELMSFSVSRDNRGIYISFLLSNKSLFSVFNAERSVTFKGLPSTNVTC